MLRLAAPTQPALGLLLVAALLPVATGQCEETHVTPSLPGTNRIGTAVAIDGDLALTTETQWGPNFVGPDQVQALEFMGGAWVPAGTLPPPSDLGPNDRFGVQVALSGETAAVLVHRALIRSQVFVYTRSAGGWQLEQALTPNPSALVDGLALDGDRLAAGSRIANALVGEVYVYERGGGAWSLDQTVVPSTVPAVDFLGFGHSIDLSGDRMAVGTFPLGAPFQSGAAYVMERTGAGWAEAGFLVPPTLSVGDRFGMDVAIDGDWTLVGAVRDSSGSSFGGLVHAFHRTGAGWDHAQTLTPAGQAALSLHPAELGDRVELSGHRAAASLDRQSGTPRGSGIQTWELIQGIWTPSGIVRPIDPQPSDGFGRAMGMDQGRLMASRPETASPSKVFIFEDHGDCTYPRPIGTSVCGPAVPNSTGLGALTTAEGHPAASAGVLMLRTSNVPSGSVGYYLTSQSAGMSTPPGSMGVLCLGGSIGRFNDAILFAGVDQTFARTVNLTALPTTPNQPALAGQTWRFQSWFRDANPNVTSNFSDAVEILFQ